MYQAHFPLSLITGGGKNNKQYNDKIQSESLDWLRFPLILGVIFIHALGPALTEVGPNSYYDYIRIIFSHVLTHVAVPCFFVISGLFFFWNIREWSLEAYASKLRKRLRSLFIPYMLWNTIAIALTIFRKLLSVLIKGKPVSELIACIHNVDWIHAYWDSSWWDTDHVNFLGWSMARSGPYSIPMWFLRDLMVLIVLTPVIYWLVRRLRLGWPALLGLFYLSNLWPCIPGLGIGSIFYFSIGAFFGINKINMVQTFRCVRYPIALLAAILFVIEVKFDGHNTPIGNIIYPFWILTAVVTTINIAASLVAHHQVKDHPVLGKSSFFIYCLYTILVLEFSSKIMSKLLPGSNELLMTLRYLTTPLLCATLCLVIFLSLRKCLPGLLGVITGNRE